MQPWPFAKPEHGDVWEPRTSLTPVDIELLEPPVEIRSERARTSRGIVEDDHPDTSRLAVAGGLERERAAPGGSIPQRREDVRQLMCGAAAEECERDVQMLPGDASALVELTRPPLVQGGHDADRQSQSEKE